MPRDVNNIYELPPGSEAAPGTLIKSAPYNQVILDLEQDANTPRPIGSGGTGADNTADARANLGLTVGSNVQAFSVNLQQIADAVFADNDFIQKKSGSFTNRTPAQVKSEIGAAASGNNTDINSISLNYNGLKLKDSDGSHELTVLFGSPLTAPRSLTLFVANGDRQITLTTNLVIGGIHPISFESPDGPSGVFLPTTGTLATLANAETLDNKTINSPIINIIRNPSLAQFNLPGGNVNSTIATTSLVETLSNKTLVGPSIGAPIINNAFMTGSTIISGTATAPTPPLNDISSRIANTSWVISKNYASFKVGSAPVDEVSYPIGQVIMVDVDNPAIPRNAITTLVVNPASLIAEVSMQGSIQPPRVAIDGQWRKLSRNLATANSIYQRVS